MTIFKYITALILIMYPVPSTFHSYGLDLNDGGSRRLKSGKDHVQGKVTGRNMYSQERFLSPMADIVTLGDRPYHLLDVMKPSTLKDELMQCATSRSSFRKSDFSISHRGANLHYPEHTERSLKAASLMGAGII